MKCRKIIKFSLFFSGEASRALGKGLLEEPYHHRPESLACYSSQCKANGKGCYSITCQKYSQNISASVREAFETVKSLIKEGSKHGYQLTSNLCISDKPEVAVEALKNLVKNLMRTKDEVFFSFIKRYIKISKISILFFLKRWFLMFL